MLVAAVKSSRSESETRGEMLTVHVSVAGDPTATDIDERVTVGGGTIHTI